MAKRNKTAAATHVGAMPYATAVVCSSRSPVVAAFDKFASFVTRWAGSPVAFGVALVTVIVWACVGPLFGFSDQWQLVINTGTTILTFLMVFLIQQSQNKDSVAVHLKLNQLLASHREASNRLVGIEDLGEQELRAVAQFYARLAETAREHGSAKEIHSLDECMENIGLRKRESAHSS